MRKSYAIRIVLYAVFTAFTVAFLFLSAAIKLPLFLLPLIVMVYFMDLRAAVFESIAFGLISITIAFTMGGSFVALAFVAHPWVAIVPRLFIGPAAWGTKALMKKATKNSKNYFLKEILTPAAVGAVAVLTNSILVISSFAIFYMDLANEFGMMSIAIGEMIISGAIELACAVVLTPPLTIAIKKATGSRLFADYDKKIQTAETIKQAKDIFEHKIDNEIKN